MRRGILSLLMVLGAAPIPGQDIVPGSGTEVVRLDVLVTDAQGKLVRGLTRDDFELREDGKPQKLGNFALATRAAQGGTPPADAASSAAPAPAAAAASGGTVNVGLERYIAIVVDDLHIARSNVEYTREALARLLDEFLLPEDNVAFVTTSGAVVVPRMTRDRAGLKAAIARLSYREAQIGPARGADITPAQAEMILAGDMNALRLASASVVAEPGSTFESANTSPQAALNNAPGASVSEAPVERAADEEVKRRVRGILQEALHYSGASMVAVADVLRGLASAPGRKICLLLSDGFLVGARTSEERTADLRNIIDAATRSGAVVYTLETRGLVTGSDAAVAGRNVSAGLQVNVSHASEQLNRNTLATLAEDTGGFLVSDTNDLARGLRLMLEDNEAYYLMAYEPTNTKRDGKFRKIELRVPRFKNYKIRTRKGYLAPDDKARAQVAQGPAGARPAPATALPSLSPSEAIALLQAPQPDSGVPIRLSADFVDLPPAGAQAVVRAHVDLAGLDWKQVEGRQRTSLDLMGAVFDAQGQPVGSAFGKRSDFNLTPAEHKKATETGLNFEEHIALPPGRYQVRLALRGPDGAHEGGARQAIEIPDLSQKNLTMSGVFLSTSAATAGASADALPEGFRDVQARRRFKRGDGLFFQVYVYNPTLDEAGKSDVMIQAQILAAKKPLAASKPQPAVFQDKDAVPLPQANGMSLEGMAEGVYTLRIVAVDRKANATIFRDVDFIVE